MPLVVARNIQYDGVGAENQHKEPIFDFPPPHAGNCTKSQVCCSVSQRTCAAGDVWRPLCESLEGGLG